VAIYLDNNVGLKIATVDLSEYVTSITLTQTFDEVETTAMGAVFLTNLARVWKHQRWPWIF
jgi:hypothetical protein